MSAQSDALVAQLAALAADDVKRLVFETTANLVETTPVDTGWARANWIPSIGEPEDATFGERTAVSSDAQEAGIADMLGYQLAAGPAYVSNNVDYIDHLNDGTSTKAPAGFVESAIERGVQTVQAASTDAVLQ